MCEQRFYICKKCGNMVGRIHDAGVPMICCGEPMTQLEANTQDASQEKHVPVATVEGNTVRVRIGSADHPMVPEHLIEWVYLQTERGGQRKCLKAGEAPAVDFIVANDKPVAVFAYCNLHSLWKTDL